MSESFSRRDWLKTVGAAGVGASIPGELIDAQPAMGSTSQPIASQTAPAPGDIVELYSTSDVFIPPRGRSFMKFSFDFPEPGVVFGDHRFSFLIFTDENTYSLDRSRMQAKANGDSLELTCDRLVWGGGQQTSPGKLTAKFTKTGSTIEWSVIAEAEHPIKTVTTVVRDVPRGLVSLGGGPLTDTRDGDTLGGYTFGAGDLHNFGVTSMTTAVGIVQV